MDAGWRDNRWATYLCTWPPGCSPLVLPPCQRWAALECSSAWLVVDMQVKACSRETHSPSPACKIYGHNAFQIIHIHATVINSGHAHTKHRTHCGLWLSLQSWLMPQSPHRPRNDPKCVEWDVKPCSIQSNPKFSRFLDFGSKTRPRSFQLGLETTSTTRLCNKDVIVIIIINTKCLLWRCGYLRVWSVWFGATAVVAVFVGHTVEEVS